MPRSAAALALNATGIVMLPNPRLVFEPIESWKHSGGGEPSGFYLWETRFGGALSAQAGTAGLALPFISEAQDPPPPAGGFSEDRESNEIHPERRYNSLWEK